MTVTIRHGDCREVLRTLPDESVHCCVTSPPYFGLRDYGVAGQIGLEPTPEDFVHELVAVFREVRRVLRDDGTLWLNLGDSYAGSWGAQGRQGPSGLMADRSVVQARSIEAHPKRLSRTGSIRQEGLKPKDLIGTPWMAAFALRADGWYLRQDIIWAKPNPMPESVQDRCTKAHEYIFLLSKSQRYYYDADLLRREHARDWSNGRSGGTLGPNGKKRIAVAESDPNFRNGHSQWERDAYPEPNPAGANKRSVWEVATQPFSGAHFATFPPALIEPCILAGCPAGGTVLDPFGGAGTTGMVADRLGRNGLLIELNPEYAAMAERRIRCDAGMFADVSSLILDQ